VHFFLRRVQLIRDLPVLLSDLVHVLDVAEHGAHARRRENDVEHVDARRLVRVDHAALESRERNAVVAAELHELARLLREHCRHAVEPPLRRSQLTLERVQSILRTRDVVSERGDLRVDNGDLLREDALLRLRVRDLRVERGDAVVDLALLAMNVACGCRRGEQQHTGQSEQQAARHWTRFARSRTDSC
jgi:hypothetical protein